MSVDENRRVGHWLLVEARVEVHKTAPENDEESIPLGE
jgi:hypothetical protein